MDCRFEPSLRRRVTVGVSAFFLFAAAAVAASATASWAASGQNQVLATVGNHQITEKEVDAKIRPQVDAMQALVQRKIYELKKQAIDSMTDEYLLEQAAKKENLSADDYLKHHLGGKKISAADAKQFYDQHKELQTRYPKYDAIKDRLVVALQNQHDGQEKQALLAKLRKDQPIKVLLPAPRVEVSSAGHPELGANNAPVTIVEFSDFQCPFCRGAEPALKQVRAKYGDKVKLVYMDFPLGMHEHAMDAASAGRCAGEQGKFWPFHDQLFADQKKLAANDLKATAKKVGLDTAKFDSCLDQHKYKNQIEADIEEGSKLGVDGTPAFFINGRPLTGAQPFASFASIIDDELSGSGQKQARAN